VRITGVIWLRDIIDKLDWKHNVSPEEVEQVLESRPRFRKLERGDAAGEDLYAALGRTDAGR
jgi:hypothetical protein